MARLQEKYSRRSIALFWLAIISIVIFSLIYFEQIAVLYILATLSLVVLLLIVGFADLEKVSRDKVGSFASKVE
jgi:hypothetical protein